MRNLIARPLYLCISKFYQLRHVKIDSLNIDLLRTNGSYADSKYEKYFCEKFAKKYLIFRSIIHKINIR